MSTLWGRLQEKAHTSVSRHALRLQDEAHRCCTIPPALELARQTCPRLQIQSAKLVRSSAPCLTLSSGLDTMPPR